MPGYKLDQGCIWDLSVGMLIVAGLVWASVRVGNRAQPGQTLS